MGKSFTFYYDIVCPFAYTANLSLKNLAARTQSKVIYKPVLLGGIYEATKAPQGKDGSASDVMPASKKQFFFRDFRMMIDRNKVPLKYPVDHPRKSLYAMRLLAAADDINRPALTDRLYKAYWVDDLDISKPDVLSSILKEPGLNVNLDIDVIEDQKVKDALASNTSEAIEHGAFGVPSFVVDGTLYFGVDRMHFLERALGNTDAAPQRLFKSKPMDLYCHTKRPTLKFYFDFASPYAYLGMWMTQSETMVRTNTRTNMSKHTGTKTNTNTLG
eukprot:Colp12_sorted_trinity150504_noHs@31918